MAVTIENGKYVLTDTVGDITRPAKSGAMLTRNTVLDALNHNLDRVNNHGCIHEVGVFPDADMVLMEKINSQPDNSTNNGNGNVVFDSSRHTLRVLAALPYVQQQAIWMGEVDMNVDTWGNTEIVPRPDRTTNNGRH